MLHGTVSGLSVRDVGKPMTKICAFREPVGLVLRIIRPKVLKTLSPEP